MVFRGKKTGKKKALKRSQNAQVKGGAVGFLDDVIKSSSGRMGRPDRFVGDEAERIVIGMPLRPFSLQWLYLIDVWPFGRSQLLAGEYASCKSALLYEEFAWHLKFAQEVGGVGDKDTAGGAVFVLNEPRDTAPWRASFFRYHGVYDSPRFRMRPDACQSLEESQDRVTEVMKRFDAATKTPGSITWPFMIGLDSLTGTTSNRIGDGIMETGHATPQFGLDANLINMYMKTMLPRIACWPLNWVYTSHAKWDVDRFGNKHLRIPGGTAVWYFTSFVLLMSNRGEIKRQGTDGCRLNLKTYKNSFGPRFRSMDVEVIWTYNEDNQQLSHFDWDSATVELLAEHLAESFHVKLNDIISFPTMNVQVRTCSCPRLGIRQAAPYEEVGKAIAADPKLMAELQDYFHIQRHTVFRPGINYLQQIREAVEAGKIVQVEKQEPPEEVDLEPGADETVGGQS